MDKSHDNDFSEKDYSAESFEQMSGGTPNLDRSLNKSPQPIPQKTISNKSRDPTPTRIGEQSDVLDEEIIEESIASLGNESGIDFKKSPEKKPSSSPFKKNNQSPLKMPGFGLKEEPAVQKEKTPPKSDKKNETEEDDYEDDYEDDFEEEVVEELSINTDNEDQKSNGGIKFGN